MAESKPEIVPRIDLWFGKACDVPEGVAVCPECGGALYVHCNSWDTETGRPLTVGLQVDCVAEEWILAQDEDAETGHRWWQSYWQGVVDMVRQWAEAIDD